MSRFARIAVALIVLAAVVLEVVVSWIYIDDPDTIFANVAILFYALIAVGAVGVVDRIIRVRRGQAEALLSRFAGGAVALILLAVVALEVVPGVDGFSVIVFAITAVLLILLGDLIVGRLRRLVGWVRHGRVTPV